MVEERAGRDAAAPGSRWTRASCGAPASSPARSRRPAPSRTLAPQVGAAHVSSAACDAGSLLAEFLLEERPPLGTRAASAPEAALMVGLDAHSTAMYKSCQVSRTMEISKGPDRRFLDPDRAWRSWPKRDSYGYAILQRVRELSGGRMEWTDGMLYPVLHRLERLGHVEARWEVAESGRRRKYYRITSRGRTQLAEEREQWQAVDATLRGIWRALSIPVRSSSGVSRATTMGA